MKPQTKPKIPTSNVFYFGRSIFSFLALHLFLCVCCNCTCICTDSSTQHKGEKRTTRNACVILTNQCLWFGTMKTLCNCLRQHMFTKTYVVVVVVESSSVQQKNMLSYNILCMIRAQLTEPLSQGTANSWYFTYKSLNHTGMDNL